MDIRIIYEDNHVLVVNKPVNVPVQADDSRDPDLLNALKAHLKEKYNKPGNVFLGLVHRLDRPVGGVLVFGKTSKGASRLSEQIRKNQFIKKYIAIVEGEHYNSGCISLLHYIKKDERLNKVAVFDSEVAGSKKSELEYRSIAVKDGKTLVEINLKTGRKHQIRAQFSKTGHPLVGDVKYGRGDGKTNIALFAYELGFLHPTSKEQLLFRAAPNMEAYPWSCFVGEINELCKEFDK